MNPLKRSRMHFAIGALAYALVLLLAVGGWLFWLTGYLKDYESSRTDHIARDWLAAAPETDLAGIVAPTVAELNTNISPEAECETTAAEILRGATITKSPSESDERNAVYAVSDGNRRIGTVVLTADGKTEHGFDVWTLNSYSFDFLYLAHEESITVPSDWSVSWGDCIADDSMVTAGDLRYELLGTLYENDEGIALPTMVTYTSGLFIGDKPLTVRDADGSIRTERDEAAYADNCTEEEKTALTALSDNFLYRYMLFSSNYTKSEYYNFENMAQYLVPESRLYTLLESAISSQYWTSSRYDTLENTDYHGFMNIGNGYYVADVTYTVTTQGNTRTFTADNNVRLVVSDTENGLLVYAMYSY